MSKSPLIFASIDPSTLPASQRAQYEALVRTYVSARQLPGRCRRAAARDVMKGKWRYAVKKSVDGKLFDG